MDNKSTTKRMIGAVVLVLIAALLLAWLLKGKNKSVQQQQELIADQTQDASPILGFPGVSKEGEQAADNAQLAEGDAAQGDAAQGDSAGYVLGSAAQQAQDATVGAVDSAQQLAADASSTVVETVADAADTAQEAGEDITSKMLGNAEDKAGLELRDQRQIVENGEAKPGVGSMGGSEVATAAGAATDGQDSAAGQASAEQKVADSGAAATAGDGADQTKSAAASKSDTAQVASNTNADAENKAAVKIANPKLVNETPVPAPRTQTAAASKKTNADDSSTASATGATRGAASTASTASSAAASASGYAIQVLAASSPNIAETVRKSIAQDGYPTFVVKASVDGKTVYRVRVGTYPAQGAARAVQTRMKARYSKNQYVQNSFVTKN